MWHQSSNKLISLISLLFLFIKSGVGLVYLKLVRKHTQLGNSLRAMRARCSPPRPLWKVFWVANRVDPVPLSFLLLIFRWIGKAVYCMLRVWRKLECKGHRCSHTSKTSLTTEVQYKPTESHGGHDGSLGSNECQLTGILVLIDTELCPLRASSSPLESSAGEQLDPVFKGHTCCW